MAITDLTGTKWLLRGNSSWSTSTGQGVYSVNYKLTRAEKEDTFIYIGLGYFHWGTNGGNVQPLANAFLYCKNTQSSPFTLYSTIDNSATPAAAKVFVGKYTADMRNSTADDTYIEFLSGTDVTNPDLIAWVEANATLQPSVTVYDLTNLDLAVGYHRITARAAAPGYRDSEPSNEIVFYVRSITGNITNGTLAAGSATKIYQGGTAQVTISPDSGYGLPASIGDLSISGATITNYNSTTGVVTISNPTSDVTLTATCPSAPAGYTVNIGFSGGARLRVFDGTDDTGTLLKVTEVTEMDFSVVCMTGSLYFMCPDAEIRSVDGSNGATSTNPSTITQNNASIYVWLRFN